MKLVKARIIIGVLLFTSIPAFLSYLSSSDYIFSTLIKNGVLSENVNITFIQDICLGVSVVFSAGFLSFSLAKAKIHYEETLNQRNRLIKMTKDILQAALVEKFSKAFSSFDIRIFVPKHPRLYAIFKFLHIKNHKVTYAIKNIPEIAEAGTTRNLEFEVSQKNEGLVSICYKNRAMVYDDNLTKNNATAYNMGENQIFQTANLEWSICCPVFGNTNDVVAIIALDGKEKLTIDKSKETDLSKQIIVFSRMLYDAVPQLFRR